MKKLFCIPLLFFACFNSNSQNWAPFPEDSLFFEPTENMNLGYYPPSSYLVPLVKSGDPTNLFQKTNPAIEWSKISVLLEYEWSQNTLPVQNWLGKIEQIGNKVIISTSSNDLITLDISKNLNHSDTVNLQSSIWANTANTKLVSKIDSVWFDGVDSLKSISFNFIDSLNAEISDSIITQFNPQIEHLEHYNLSQQKVIWSKNHGIIQTPSFNFFPYCNEYKKIDKIMNILPSDRPYSFDIFWNDIGDEIHTKKYQSLNPQHYNLESIKIIVTDISYDTTNNILYKTYDEWIRIDTSFYDGLNNIVYAGLKSTSFIPNKKDTINLLSYTELNTKIPNGLATLPNANHGYFYNNSTKEFIRESHYQNVLFMGLDSLNIQYFTDGETRKDFYKPNTGGKFFESSEWSEHDYYLPIYSNFNGITTGSPFSDAFLLSVNEIELPTNFYIQNSTLFIAGEHNFDHNPLRIYDVSGKLTKASNSLELENGIDISGFNSGVYFVIYNQNSKTRRFKFVKE